MKISPSNVASIILATIMLSSIFFVVASSSVGEYDPWLDTNDDGMIDMRDIGALARAFGASGQPINKTYLLYYAINMVTELNATFEARLPQREIISIPAAAFTPYLTYAVPPTDWWNHGYCLTNKNGTRDILYVAPVQLPHGVKVTRVYIFWYDAGDDYVGAYLFKSEANHTSSGSLMVALTSPEKAAPGWGSSNTNIIEHSIIDNYRQYHILVNIPPSISPLNPDYYFYYAIIEYEYPA